MDTLYGMPLPLGAHPTLPLGGQELVDSAQYGGPTPEAIAAEQQRNQAAQAAQVTQAAAATQAATQAKTQQAAQSQLVDWPTYLANHSPEDPAVVYDDYLNTAGPTMWAAMGLPPDQVKRAQELFAQRVPRPASVPRNPNSGFFGNAGGAIAQETRGTLRAMSAGGAVATGDVEKLAKLAAEQAGEEALTPESLKRWQKTGGLVWNDLSRTAQNLLQEPQGATDAALQAIVSFVPFIASGAVGGLAGPVGAAAAMGLTAADLAAGSTALRHIQEGLHADGIDVNDAMAVRTWVEGNGSKVFGDSWKAAGTEGAVTALTMGVAGGKGAQIARNMQEAAQVGVAEATAKAAGVEATRAGTATAASLRAAQRVPTAAKIATEVGGLGASGVLGALAAGDTPETNDVITQSMAMLIPSLLHARGQFKSARTVEANKPVAVEKRPSTKETVGDEAEFPPAPPEEPPASAATETPASSPEDVGQRGKGVPEPFSMEELTATYQRMQDQRLDDEVAVRSALGLPEKTKGGTLKKTVLADEVRDVAEAATPEDKIAALERLADAADKKGKADVVERAQAKADELRKLEPPTEDEVTDTAAAVHVARDIVQEAVNEHAQEVATEVKAQIDERKQARAAAGTAVDTTESAPAPVAPVPPATGLPPAGRRTATGRRKAGLKQDTAVQQGVGGEDKGRPADNAGLGVDQKVPVQAVAPVPERGQPVGTAGAGGETTPARPNRKNRLRAGKTADEPASIVGPDRLTDVTIQKKTAAEPTRYYTWQELYDQFKQRFAGSNKFPNVSDLIGSDWGVGGGHLDTPERYWHAAEDRFLLKYGGPTFDTKAGLDRITPKAPLTKEAIKERSDAYYVRKMIDSGFDRETAKTEYNADPEYWRSQVDGGALDEKPVGRVKPTPEKDRDLGAVEEGPVEKIEPMADKTPDQDRNMLAAFKTNEGEVSLIGGKQILASEAELHTEFVKILRTGRGTSTHALNYLAGRSQSLLTRTLARQLQQVLGKVDIPVRVVDNLKTKDGNRLAGRYRYLTSSLPEHFEHRAIELNGDTDWTGLNEHTLLHELAHAATTKALLQPQTMMQRVFAERFKNIYDQAKNSGLTDAEHYGMTNPMEFLSEAWSNPEFQRLLDRLPYRAPEQFRNLHIPTLWAAFKDSVAKLFTERFGLKAEPTGRMSLLQAAIAHSSDLFDTYSKVTTHSEDTLRKAFGEVANEGKRRETEAETAFAKTPHDAIVGYDPAKGDERTHIAYRQSDGTYNMYDVTVEQPRGDPETKRVGLSPEAVREAIGESGSQPLQRSGADFRGDPVTTKSEINGWKDGARQFAAFKQPDGRWHVYQGEDLSDRAQRGVPKKYADFDAVMAEYRKGGFLKTEAQDAARQRDNAPRPIGTYEGPNQMNLNWWDRRAPIRYLSEQMQQQFGHLPESLRPDIPALLKTSWANRDLRALQRDEIDPMVDKGRSMLKQHNVSGEQFDKDITALASEERSRKKLAGEAGYEDFPELKGKLTNNLDAARAHLAALDPAYLRDLKDYASDLKVFADKTIDEAARFGLIDEGKATAIKSAYEYYVPIQTGKRTSVGKRATGASAESEHPMQRLIEQRKATIIRGYDNMEKRAVYDLASTYNIKLPDGSNMFDIAPILKYGFDRDGMLTTVLDPLVMKHNAVPVMIDGKPYRMGINDEDFLKAIKDRPASEAVRLMRGAAIFNAVYGGLKTAVSPVFAVKNYARDVATALAQNDPRISTTRLATSLVSPKIWLAALHDAMEIGKHRVGGRHGEIADFAARVRDAGGLIDRKAIYGLDNIVEDVSADVDPNWIKRLPGSVAKQFSLEHGAITKPITMWTKTLENATRMAVFDAAEKSGLSVSEAAKLAKTTTVNFEPKGHYAGIINPLYVFANAKLQGTRTYAEKLGFTGLKGGNAVERLQRGNRRTQIVTGLGLLVGMLAAKYGYDTSEKDADGRSTYGKLSDYQKDDYLTVKSGGVSVPLPPELAASYVAGQSIVDAMMNDRWPDAATRRSKAAIRFGSAMAQTFVPGGTSMSDPVSDKPGKTADYWLRLVLPTPLSVLHDTAANTSTFGSPVITGLKPGVPLYATNAANYPNSAAVAQKLHETTGMNVAPQTLKYFTDQWVKPQVDVFKSIFGEPEPGKQGVWERTFFQTASPLVDKNDLDEIKDRVVADTYNPLKKGKAPELKMFKQSDDQIKKVMKGWDNATPERRQQMNERANAIRANTLKRYQQAIEQAEGATP